MQTAELWGPNQLMGNRWPVGCIALEITQRCNLDCSVCYLSPRAETVGELAVENVLDRIDAVHRYFGPGTNVQITGGEPTVRNSQDLLKIVGRVSDLGMHPTLMTNGIRLNRPLLKALVRAGLADIAFHVDTTQQRNGYDTEKALNAVRRRYIAMASNLPVAVYFNTTVWTGNLHQIPEIVTFFNAHAHIVRIASFQLQADTGRGRMGKRHRAITQTAVIKQIAKGAGIPLNFDNLLVGNPRCSRTSICLIANGHVYDALDDRQLVGKIHAATPQIPWLRAHPLKTTAALLRWLAANPRFAGVVARWTASKLRAMKSDLIKSRGRLDVQSFLIHGFMDADDLDSERLATCAFKTMTDQGPVSMCLFNARRDVFFENYSVMSGGQTTTQRKRLYKTNTEGG